jgi:hypothetical protein
MMDLAAANALVESGLLNTENDTIPFSGFDVIHAPYARPAPRMNRQRKLSSAFIRPQTTSMAAASGWVKPLGPLA